MPRRHGNCQDGAKWSWWKVFLRFLKLACKNKPGRSLLLEDGAAARRLLLENVVSHLKFWTCGLVCSLLLAAWWRHVQSPAARQQGEFVYCEEDGPVLRLHASTSKTPSLLCHNLTLHPFKNLATDALDSS